MQTILLLSLFVIIGACLPGRARSTAAIAGGTAEKGEHLGAWYGCGSCHEIPGLRGATGRVGPSLRHISRRAYITSSVPNTPANLVRWIQAPRVVDARTIMPDMNIPEQDARDIAAFLYAVN